MKQVAVRGLHKLMNMLNIGLLDSDQVSQICNIVLKGDINVPISYTKKWGLPSFHAYISVKQTTL